MVLPLIRISEYQAFEIGQEFIDTNTLYYVTNLSFNLVYITLKCACHSENLREFMAANYFSIKKLSNSFTKFILCEAQEKKNKLHSLEYKTIVQTRVEYPDLIWSQGGHV